MLPSKDEEYDFILPMEAQKKLKKAESDKKKVVDPRDVFKKTPKNTKKTGYKRSASNKPVKNAPEPHLYD